MTQQVARILAWYKVYCVIQAGIHLVLVAFAMWVIQRREQLATDLFPSWWILVAGICLGGVWVFFLFANLKLIWTPPTKAWWTIHLINLLLGVSACVTLPICLPLLFYWFKPSLRAYFDQPAA